MPVLPYVIQPWALYAVIAVFAIGAIVNLLAPGSIRSDYVRWGYPEGFRLVTAMLEASVVVLILLPSTRLSGLVLGGLIMLAAIATLVRAGEYRHMIPAAILLALCILLI